MSCKHLTLDKIKELSPGVKYEKLYLSGISFIKNFDNTLAIIEYMKSDDNYTYCKGHYTCVNCNNKPSFYYVNDLEKVRYSIRDDLMKIPVKSYDILIKKFAHFSVFNAPRFGTFIHLLDIVSGKSLIIYFPTATICKTIYCNNILNVNGKLTVGIHTPENKLTFVNSDGERITDYYSVFCEPNNEYIFKVGGGELSGIGSLGGLIEWTYTTEPALKTKPALAAAE
jgi:hypothetical protein